MPKLIRVLEDVLLPRMIGVIGAVWQNRSYFCVFKKIKHLQRKLKNTRRMLIYKGNLLLGRFFWSKTGDFRGYEKTAPKTADIPLAQPGLIKVELYRPDFDNGMKTTPVPAVALTQRALYRPDFDNGMKTLQLQTHKQGRSVVPPGL